MQGGSSQVFLALVSPAHILLDAPAGLIFAQTILGHLFVRSYRIFSKSIPNATITLFRRSPGQTIYAYFALIQQEQSGEYTHITQSRASLIMKSSASIDMSISLINQMKQTQQTEYLVIFAFTKSKQILELTKEQYTLVKKTNAVDDKKLIPFIIPQKKQDLLVESSAEFSKLEVIIYNYIDTFGLRYKTNFFSDLDKTSTTSYQTRTLLNTINHIIFIETQQGNYSQIQSSNWTCFQARNKEKMANDRKDIVLTGGARILLLKLIFLQDMDTHVNKSAKEMKEVMTQCKKSYREGCVKIWKIWNTIDQSGILYKKEDRIVQKYQLN